MDMHYFSVLANENMSESIIPIEITDAVSKIRFLVCAEGNKGRGLKLLQDVPLRRETFLSQKKKGRLLCTSGPLDIYDSQEAYYAIHPSHKDMADRGTIWGFDWRINTNNVPTFAVPTSDPIQSKHLIMLANCADTGTPSNAYYAPSYKRMQMCLFSKRSLKQGEFINPRYISGATRSWIQNKPSKKSILSLSSSVNVILHNAGKCLKSSVRFFSAKELIYKKKRRFCLMSLWKKRCETTLLGL